MFEFKLPDLGEGVHEGEILHWHVKPGDRVESDDPLVEVETDKAAVTIPSPRAGTVVSIKGDVGESVAVGAVLVVIDETSAKEQKEQTEGAVEQIIVSSEESSEESSDEPSEAVVAAPSDQNDNRNTKQSDRDRDAASSSQTPSRAADRSAPTKQAMKPAGRGVQRSEERPSASAAPVSAPPSQAQGPVPAAPATRRKAREMGIDLAQVEGSGPAGRVSIDDLLRFAEQKSSRGVQSAAPSDEPRQRDSASAPADRERSNSDKPKAAAEPVLASGGESGIPFFEVERLPDFAELGPVEREPLRSIRRKVAHKMVASMTIVPHVAHMDEADVTDLDRFRREQNGSRTDGSKLTLLSFVIKAVVAQLKRMPNLNASIDPHRQEIVYKKYYNVGFAADTPKGLVVPVIAGADRLSVVDIGSRLQQLAEKARAGSLDVSELRGGTFTITNVGSLGGTNVIPTINYPEVAILGLGRASEKPVVRAGRIVIRLMLPLTLSFDHRLVDGADAARFVTAVVSALSDPGRLLIES